MFGMLHGGLPRITQDGIDLDALEADVAAGRATGEALREAVDRLVAEVVAVQVEAGLELVTDGQVRWPDLETHVLAALDRAAEPGEERKAGRDGASEGFLVDAWRATAALTDRPVAQALPGPYSLGRRTDAGPASRRRVRTMALAKALGGELRRLAEAGCPVVIVEEPAAVEVGVHAAERRLFADAQRRLLAPVPDLHAMLAISGGSAADAGPETIFGAPYRSHFFDLIAGPDDWVLVRAAPPDRGIVCGVLRAEPGLIDDPAPILVWAANYAASTGLRGLARVGLANSTSLRGLPPAEAFAALQALGRAARLAAMTPEDAIAAGLDPRTFGNRLTPRRKSRKKKPSGG